MGNCWRRPVNDIPDIGINDIPDEVLADILNKLSIGDLKSAVLVSRLWRQEGESPSLWKSCRVQIRNREDIRNLAIRRLRLIEGIDFRPERGWRLGGWRMGGMEDGDWDLFFVVTLSLSQLKEISGLQGKPLQSVDPSLLAKALVRLDVVNLNVVNVVNLISLISNITTDQAEEFFRVLCQQKIDLTDSSKTTGQEQQLFSHLQQDKQLKFLNLRGINLSTVEPKMMGKALARMEEVDVSSTSLTAQQVQELFQHISKDSNLKQLLLKANDLSTLEPELLGKVVSGLEDVSLSQTSLTEAQVEMIFGQASRQSQWKELYLGGNGLSSVEPAALATVVKGISHVGLWDTEITDEQKVVLLTAIGEEGDIELKELDLSWNDLSTVEPHILAAAVHRVEEVLLEDTNLNIEQFICVFLYQDEESKLKTLSLWDPQKGDNVDINMVLYNERHGGFLNGCNVM